jgi:NADPH-dependent ferric siderophore reductase
MEVAETQDADTRAAAIITKYKGPEMQKPVIRPYTPVSDVDQKGTVDFIIKKYPGGAMSEHMHNMEPGQRLDIKGPIPKYQWTANKQLAFLYEQRKRRLLTWHSNI